MMGRRIIFLKLHFPIFTCYTDLGNQLLSIVKLPEFVLPNILAFPPTKRREEKNYRNTCIGKMVFFKPLTISCNKLKHKQNKALQDSSI